MKSPLNKNLLLISRLISTQLCFISLCFVNFCFADFSEHGHESEQNEVSQVLVISDNKISPAQINLTPPGGSVFFLNKSSSSFVLEIDFGKKKAHCASREVEISKTGVMKTKLALKPNEFISVCFPDKGIHTVKAGNKLNAKINVL